MEDITKKKFSEQSNYMTTIQNGISKAREKTQKYSAPPKTNQSSRDNLDNTAKEGQNRIALNNSKVIHSKPEKYIAREYKSQGKHAGVKSYIGSLRKDPFCTNRYIVEIDGNIVGGFSEISGIEISLEMGEYYEGGQNLFPYHYIKKTKYSNITLKRGLTQDTYLWDWYQDIVLGDIKKRDIAIYLVQYGKDKPIEKCWYIFKAFPVKWTGSAFNASKGEVFLESIELVHNGIMSD